MRFVPLFLLGLLLGVAGSVCVHWYLYGPFLQPSHERNPSIAGHALTIPADAATAESPYPYRWPDDGPTPEQVFLDQPALLDRAIDHLRAQTPGQVDLYLLAFAGDGDEDVFRNEVEYAARLFAQRFDAKSRTLVLANNPSTLQTTPLATWSNLETALRRLATIMDPAEDILFLYATSHGSADHYLSVVMDPLPLDSISAEDLAEILAGQPFRWKVVVVNACYSGGFIPYLQGDGTLLLTASSADRTSFGCGSESQITWFGDALLAHAFNANDDFIDAFAQARAKVASWEQRDDLEPSDPQIDIGAGIRDQLARWRAGIMPGPPLPFDGETTP